MNGPLRLTGQNDVCKYVETYNYVIIDGKIYTYSLVVSFFFFLFIPLCARRANHHHSSFYKCIEVYIYIYIPRQFFHSPPSYLDVAVDSHPI